MADADQPTKDGEGKFDEDRFWRKLILPEEDRRRRAGAPWTGGYRWFRSPNIICLERYRQLKRRGGSDD
jgi:hypothetical protein